MLPRTWNRPYLGYNPRSRDRELGPVADLANKERVFSDSEIYSPCFPRGRPGPLVDISARVRAMKAEFAEYRNQQLEEQQKLKSGLLELKNFEATAESSSSKPRSPTSPPPTTTHLATTTAARTNTPPSPEEIAAGALASERLESII